MPNKKLPKKEREFYDSILRTISSNQDSAVSFLIEKGIIRPHQCPRNSCRVYMKIIFPKEKTEGVLSVQNTTEA